MHKEIRRTVKEEITTCVKAYEDKVKSEPEAPCMSDEVFSLRWKALDIFQKVHFVV